MQTASSFFPNNSNSNNSASKASVPLSVYKDLSAELQAAQAMVDVLTTKNEQLTAENQHLRQEITKAVQSALHLQKVVDSYAVPHYSQPPHSSPDLRNPSKAKVQQTRYPQRQSSTRPNVVLPMEDNLSPAPELNPQIMYIEEEVRYYPNNNARPREMNGWFLVLAIFLVIFSAFGTGYLIVRPLFNNPNVR